MSLIHVLDDSTINKIAAGEVVERPASVVKELVENSIDAGATKIEVEILAGGTSFLRVTDNGKGMTEEDARLAILRHATSKIREASDLQTIGTLGFRGEALPTIASVSRFSMKTRPANADLGTEVAITGGKTPDIHATGASLGTTIKVEDLFFNTPARKKFLKTNHTEAAHISDFITKLALSHPEIAFRFINNNKMTLVTPGSGNLHETIRAIYGKTVAEALLTLAFENPTEGVKITGFITKPSMLKSTRGWQTFLVNGRLIENRAIAKAIDNAYKSMVPKSGYPMVVLNLTVPPRTVDVNVHPQKSEMKFEDESMIFKAVYKATLDAVRPAQGLGLSRVAASVESPAVHAMQQTQEAMHFVPATAPSYTPNPADYQPRTMYEAVHHGGYAFPEQNGTASESVRSWSNVNGRKDAGGVALQGTGNVSFAEAQQEIAAVRATRYNDPSGITQNVAEGANVQTQNDAAIAAENAFLSEGAIVPIGQVDRTYIIAQDAKGLYIIDQHAAHERILFDKFSAQAEGIPSQQLLVHPILSFDAGEAALIEAHADLFASLGFHLESAGPQDYRLTECPADIPTGEAEDIIREILTNLHDLHAASAAELRKHALATTACRAAIKAGEELNFAQMQIILDELSRTPQPFTCPHGRPTILKFSTDDLAKMFKRTGFDLKK
ncbi:DNA mismatch repair endonuclease MutL [uncultured Selenomonas sp.]|uniref:DNA mismatch repair endonuclease MutL n=1 Tax=uncultured Selenomonas sp. TaxID=159275 RepID=UPI0025ED56D3|nr:DNA mismatch repair endonuclease MutL [uncultured Selenomonas sp.]